MNSKREPDSGWTTALLDNGHLLFLSIAILLVAGVSALVNLPRLEDPRLTTRNATILTLLPGASAARVEALVSEKLEKRLREVSEIKTIGENEFLVDRRRLLAVRATSNRWVERATSDEDRG